MEETLFTFFFSASNSIVDLNFIYNGKYQDMLEDCEYNVVS